MISIHLIAQSSSLNIHETIWVRHLSMKIHFWVVIRPLLQAMNFIAKIEIFSEFSSCTRDAMKWKQRIHCLFWVNQCNSSLYMYNLRNIHRWYFVTTASVARMSQFTLHVSFNPIFWRLEGKQLKNIYYSI